MKAYTCYLSLGANLGNREETIICALRELAHSAEIQLTSISSLYETPPWGNLEQPQFLNCAASIKTGLTPKALLAFCQSVENKLGRVRHEHWGARTIDIDLLYIPEVFIQEEDLQLPHPYMLQRAFVLVPLAEVAHNLIINKHTIAEYVDRLTDADTIKSVQNAKDVWQQVNIQP